MATDIVDVDYTLQSALNQKWEGATRVRLGYAMDRWMPFIAGGLAYKFQ